MRNRQIQLISFMLIMGFFWQSLLIRYWSQGLAHSSWRIAHGSVVTKDVGRPLTSFAGTKDEFIFYPTSHVPRPTSYVTPAPSQSLRPRAAGENLSSIYLLRARSFVERGADPEGLGYEIKPLSAELMGKLPDMIVGARIVAIIKERGFKNPAEARKAAGIKSGTFSHMINSDTIPHPGNLFAICRVLHVDPIIVIKGRPWEEISAGLPDNEKMNLLRLRRGWTQEELALALEKAGLRFDTASPDSKRTTVTQWLLAKAAPMLEKQLIIKRVLGDSTLFATAGPKEVIEEVKTEEKKPLGAEEPRIEPVQEKPETAKREEPVTTPVVAEGEGPEVIEIPEKEGTPPAQEAQEETLTIQRKADEIRQGLSDLARIQIDEATDIESIDTIGIIRLLIEDLRELDLDQAVVLDRELGRKITEIEKRIAALKKGRGLSKAERKKASRAISSYLEQFRGKSIVQILPLLVKSRDWVAVRVAVERVESGGLERLHPADLQYLYETKSRLREAEQRETQLRQAEQLAKTKELMSSI
jgi:transcriptional regulator with XRE-family HTH domain